MGPFHLGDAHIICPFSRITNPACPNSRQPWKPRWAEGEGGGGGGARAFFSFACAPEIVYSSIGVRVHELIQFTSGKNISKSSKRKKRGSLARIFAQILPEFAKILPEFAPKLPEFCPNIAPILPGSYRLSLAIFFGGNGAPPPPRLIRLCKYEF